MYVLFIGREINKYVRTAHNKRYTLRRPFGRLRGSVLLGQSLRSFPRKTSPTFWRARLALPNIVYLFALCAIGTKLIGKYEKM